LKYTGEYHRTHKTRKNFKRMMLKIREKIRNKVKDLHCRFSKFLCSNYNVILLPTFETQSMISKDDRVISSKTARAIATYSHYLFRQRLVHKSKEFPWCKVDSWWKIIPQWPVDRVESTTLFLDLPKTFGVHLVSMKRTEISMPHEIYFWSIFLRMDKGFHFRWPTTSYLLILSTLCSM